MINVLTAGQLNSSHLGLQAVLKHPRYEKGKHGYLVGIRHLPSHVVGRSNTALTFIPEWAGGRQEIIVPDDTEVTIYEEEG